jgi:hypothetical protein
MLLFFNHNGIGVILFYFKGGFNFEKSQNLKKLAKI